MGLALGTPARDSSSGHWDPCCLFASHCLVAEVEMQGPLDRAPRLCPCF